MEPNTARSGLVVLMAVRVISDNADPSKGDDKWRELGMKTLANLISKLPLTEVLKSV